MAWRRKKQFVITKSSVEAEFKAITQGICEEILLKRILDEIKISVNHTIRILCDNKCAITIVKNLAHHDRT